MPVSPLRLSSQNEYVPPNPSPNELTEDWAPVALQTKYVCDESELNCALAIYDEQENRKIAIT